MQIFFVGIFGREIDGEDYIQLFDAATPVSGETGVFFGQIPQQALKQFTASQEKQKEEREEGEDIRGDKVKEQVGEPVGGGDKYCRYAD